MFKRLFASLAVFFSLLLILLLTPQHTFAAPPTNFQTTQIIGSGLDGSSGFEFAPDGRIFILQRTGEIKIYKNGQLLPQNFAVLPSIASGDRGLIGIAFDPEFFTNHYVYFYYTGLDKFNYLVRMDASGDVATSDPLILYQTTDPSEELHVGGSVRFGPDGKLYFSVGDNGYPPNAQSLTNPHGKILRINKDGTIPSDNPFVGKPNALPEIWAYGLRNPYRFQFDSATGVLYAGDVGDFSWEEMNRIVKGGNYGWPTVEGNCTSSCSGFINPIYTYAHDNQSSAITGGPVYHATQFPAEYQNNLFFADYARGFIRRMVLDADGNNGGVFDFDTQAGSAVDLKVAPDGSLYYITYFPSRLYKITYSTSNHVPTANASADKTKGLDPLMVNFSSAGSSDPDNDPITFNWDFGDGTTSTDANPTHTYANKGSYTVELSVSDGVNTSQAVPIIIQVGKTPTVTVAAPVDGSTYHAGDTITVNAFANDGAGFDMNDASIKTTILFHHDTHIHPFLGPLTGREQVFTIPTTGEPSPHTWFEIDVTATDDNGLSVTKAINIYPVLTNITLDTEPSGLQVLMDGIPQSTPETFQGVVGFKRELSVNQQQIMNGKSYVFDHWSDNGAEKHFITYQPQDMAYTAVFKEAAPFTTQFYNTQDLSGDPVLTREDPFVRFDWGGNSPAEGVNAQHWSARFTKDQDFHAGDYQFTVSGDDGMRLYVDGQLVIDEWIDEGYTTYSKTVTMTEGTHHIVMEYYQDEGGSSAELSWEQLTSTQTEDTSFKAEYYANRDLSGTALSRQVDAVDFDWGGGSPDQAIPSDNFSARFTKHQTFSAGNYTFILTGDDGIRLKIDGQTVIDGWRDQAATIYSADVPLTAGIHTIVVEYYEAGGNAVAKLSWQQDTDSQPFDGTGYKGEYFTNQALVGSPALTRNDDTIDFDWGNGSPDQTIPDDHFSARWTKTINFTAGNYDFTATADDGVRVYLDNTLLIDKWLDQGPTTYTASQAVTDGPHTIKVEYYENGGGAVAKFDYQPSDGSGSTSTPYAAKYWNAGTGSSPDMPSTTPDLTRNDDTINFDWGGNSPDPAIHEDHFITQWTKQETFEDGNYRFTTVSDDGIRVFIDDQPVIDQWTDHGSTTFTADKAMTAGTHDIRVEYYENGGGAVAKFSYKKIATAPTQISGSWQAEYFDNPTLTGTPLVTREEDSVNFRWGGASPDPLIPVDNWSARFTHTQDYSAGSYIFSTISDDGIRVYVDDQLVIDDWTDHAETPDSATVNLSAGSHTIKLEYYDSIHDATAIFQQN